MGTSSAPSAKCPPSAAKEYRSMSSCTRIISRGEQARSGICRILIYSESADERGCSPLMSVSDNCCEGIPLDG